ncbi:methyltransferase domain-containing protein [Paenibacillus lutrae]|uniref:Methyltransferase domain-containing protein n=1 Tax=Paenibacillus lutrae TaxID=2078573 RepID=A0A7X3K0H4_9BACL|nr:methyltransferase domain-containing protein [Paenibacillus lutrae]MVP01163.1 methyltransferase domain-containing protein [Paenibacillus lutrae]
MFKRLKLRATEPEMMDDLTTGGEELQEALVHLRRLNKIFAAAGPTVYGVHKLWIAAGKPGSLTVLDIGAGSGDVNLQLLRWADQNGIALEITLMDITDEACREARKLFENEPRVQVVRGDLFALPVQCADIVTGTQFVHHFASDELAAAVQSMREASRYGVVLNDIHRHWIAWAAVWLTTRFISRNRYILNDGPLSVAKGFRSSEWKKLQSELADSNFHISWRPLFRHAVVIPK